MKKIIALSLIAGSLAATTAFGQGYFTFSSGKSQVFDGFTTPGTSTTSANVDVAFLWAAAGTTPDVDAFGASSSKTGNSSTTATQAGYITTQAWADILDGQFTLGQNSLNGNSLVTAQTIANGSFGYVPPGQPLVASFGVTGTSAGTTYTVYEISWNAAFSTPQLAAAAGAAVGWSNPIQYLMQGSSVTPNSYTFNQYGTFVPGVVPEPGTMALAGLGGLSLLAFRRKK